MARIRTLKPEFWADEKLSLLDPLTRLVFLGLISMADDQGRLIDNVKQLDGQLFPNTDESSRDALETLARIARIRRYVTSSGQAVIQITNWERHQKVTHPGRALLPGPEEAVIDKPPLAQRDRKSSRRPREKRVRSSGEPQETLVPLPSDLVTELPSDRVTVVGDPAPTTAAASPSKGWPARLTDHWEREVGHVDPGFLGKTLKRYVDREGVAIIETAMTYYALERASLSKPGNFKWFAEDIAQWIDNAKQPLQLEDGTFTPLGERLYGLNTGNGARR